MVSYVPRIESETIMLRLKDVPPEQMAEVVRVAGELYDEEQAQTQERRATVAAAAEMGLPKEYLDRAAAVIHARRVEQIGRRRRRKAGLLAGLGVALAIGGGWVVTHPRPAAPITYNFQNPQQQWAEESNPESQGRVTFTNGAATIHVDHFGPQAGSDQFFVNLNTKDVPPTLAGYRTVSFRAQGQGLPNLRLYLENGGERWRSPNVAVTPGGQAFRLNLDQFDHQVQDTSTGKWHKADSSAPGHVEQLSFKVGYYINNADAHGDVQVSDLRFQ